MATHVEFKSSTSSPNCSAPPIVASFSNGRLKFDDPKAGGVQFGYFRSKSTNIGSRDEKMLVAETDRVRYMGRNFGTDALAATSMCKYMLGVFDRRKNKVRLVDAALFHLRPTDGDSDEEATGEQEKRRVEDEQMTTAEKQARLTKEFGTAKGKRVVESRIRNQVKDHALESVVAAVVKDSTSAQSETTDVADSCPLSIPPHNKDATCPEDVYQLDDIISPEEMALLSGHTTSFVQATAQSIDEWRETGKYPGYIIHQLSILPVESTVRQQRACQLLYWWYLQRLLKERELNKRDTILADAPTLIRQNLLERFTMVCSSSTGVKKMRLMPARLKDLLRSYLLVLSLIIEEFSLDFTELQRDLDLSLPQLEKCFQALGCKTSRHVSKAATGQTSKSIKATLVVPLTFPTYKPRAGRR